MINSAAFIQRLNRTKTISQKLSNLLMDGIRINRFEAGEIFLSPGNSASAIYFIQAGIIRGSIEGPEEKMTTWFKQDGNLIIPSGIFNQHSSEEYLNAVIKTTVLQLPVKHVNLLMESHPELQELLILMLCESMAEGEYREKLLRMPLAKDRYNYVAEHEGYILKRVPQFLIASYLNVTKETFSRLHKGMSY